MGAWGFGASSDDDADPLVWIALADLQWSHGQLDPQVLVADHSTVEYGLNLVGVLDYLSLRCRPSMSIVQESGWCSHLAASTVS